MTPREEIVQWAMHDRSFIAGSNIYRRHGNHKGIKHKLDIQGETPQNIELLHYNLGKTAGFSEQEFNELLNNEVAELVVIDYSNTETRAKLIDEMPVLAKQGFKLREEFPFLKEKSCPDELKIMVADMLTAHDKFELDHEALFSAITPEETARLSCSVVENYIENRQIWDELIHYRENNKPLGQHPVWQREERLKELNALPQPELIKLSKNIPTNISRIKKSLRKIHRAKKQPNARQALSNTSGNCRR
jgi:hypothetical protein